MVAQIWRHHTFRQRRREVAAVPEEELDRRRERVADGQGLRGAWGECVKGC